MCKTSRTQGAGWGSWELVPVLALSAVFLAAICGCPRATRDCDCPDIGYNPVIDPNNFVDVVDNPYLPLTPGTSYVYLAETDEGTERIEVSVTDDTIEILGVTCTVVRDTGSLDGDLVEDTFDWFAQDTDGNVWYFGEASVEYNDGVVVGTFGSWKAGVDCAKPGIVMPASPQVGNAYRQEFYQCVAEDESKVLALGESVAVPYGILNNCVRTEEFSRLEPDAVEQKVYAPGIGHILTIADGERTDELVSITTN